MKLNIYVMIILSIVFTGCVSTKNVKMKKDVASQMNGKTMVTTISEKPDFAAMTADKAVFGVIGALAMISEGNKIIKENNIKDPAHFIGKKLAVDLSNKSSLNISSIGNIESIDNIEELTKKYSDKDYILDVRTINWSFAYFPTDWDNYRVIYSTKLRLIDVKNNSLLAEGFCSKVPEQTEKSPSYDELISDHAKILKSELQTSVDECLKEFRGNILVI